MSTGQDIVINATRPTPGREDEIVTLTEGLMAGLARTGVRLLVVGGAATLIVPDSGGRTVLEDSRFLPISARHIGRASAAQYEVCLRETRVDWTYLCPPAQLVPGPRKGRYRLGSDQLLLDDEGSSKISMEDLAVVLLDEAERPSHYRTRFTAASPQKL